LIRPATVDSRGTRFLYILHAESTSASGRRDASCKRFLQEGGAEVDEKPKKPSESQKKKNNPRKESRGQKARNCELL